LGVWIAPAGTVDWVLLPRQPITSVPYAFSLMPGALVHGAMASSSAALSVTQTYDASPSDSAFAIYGYGPDVGVYGRGDHTGIKGFGLNTGVRGDSGYIGVYGSSDGPTGYGVYGNADYVGVGGVGTQYGVLASGYVAIKGSSASGNLIELWDSSPYNLRFLRFQCGRCLC